MINCQKHLFNLDADVHYINGAYMSPISKAVAESGAAAAIRKLRPYTIAPNEFFSDVDRLKVLFSKIIHAQESKRVAIIPSVSYGMATVAKNVKVQKGQNIIVADAQFPSNIYTWRELAKEKDLTIKTIPYPIEIQDGRGKTWNERILDSIDNQTAIVALAHLHWANGTKFDLKRISQRAQWAGLFVQQRETLHLLAQAFE